MSRYRFLREPRWLALGFLVLLVVPAFFLLSRWQLSRLDERRYNNDLVTTHADRAPVPVDEVMTAGAAPSSVGDAQRWLPVTVTGRYDAAREVLVRKRPLQGRNGFWVATPLVTAGGTVVVVNRGWIEATGNAADAREVPPPPAGEVTVTGRVQPSEVAPAQPGDLPAGQVTDLDVALVAGPGVTAYPGYLTLESSVPAQAGDLEPLPLPDLSDGPHLSYAVQWIFFAIVAVTGFVLLARRERDYAAADADELDAAPHPPV
ncbi:MAG: SURF1 family protein [Candidatus Nanopelagicales bacterium]